MSYRLLLLLEYNGPKLSMWLKRVMSKFLKTDYTEYSFWAEYSVEPNIRFSNI
jgi:hypothetical protein